jgi:diaminobutyrate-2-oxoglutarate transaminase
MWRLARATRVLDLNSPYSYLLWCRDFAATSVVAGDPDGGLRGFVTGYVRPDRPDTLVVWQVAVDPAHRRQGLATLMLDELVDRLAARAVRRVETTVTPGNTASDRLFTAFAERRGGGLGRQLLFAPDAFPGSASPDGPQHEAEILYSMGPFAPDHPRSTPVSLPSPTGQDTAVFTALESEVRSYCRSWPTVFDHARGSRIRDEGGTSYLDFFSGAGALNYGHNNPVLKRALLDYLERDGITHGLDMSTSAKREFLETFRDLVLAPRGMDHKVMFPGPTGTNAVEAALKLARKVKGREVVVSFTNAFHGMSLGALAVTGNSFKRAGAGTPLVHATPMPFDNYLDGRVPDFLWFERLLQDSGSGLNRPAAVIVETVQGEGGVNVARAQWLRGLAALCTRHDMLLIVDDIQMGCGRTGAFFSFEEAGITPDIVTLSKSIGGYGLPLSLVLMRPELDVWQPGEHNGTFRGNNPAFVTATAALRTYWSDDALQQRTRGHAETVRVALEEICSRHPGSSHRGRGLVWGLEFGDRSRAAKVCARAFELGLLLETSGPEGEVVKLMPALTVSPDELAEGLGLLARAVDETP